MLSVGVGLSGLDALASRSLQQAFDALAESSLRLATLQQINRASDNPAGLIAVEQLRSELAAIQAADRNASRAAAYVDVAESGLAQVSDLLNRARGLVVGSAGNTLSDAERAANQLELDSILESIDRIGSSTAIGGQKLLDGSLGELQFALSPDPGELSSVELPAINTASLGTADANLQSLATGGANALASGDLTGAVETLDAARDEVLAARARLGSFERYTLEGANGVLSSIEENITSAISRLADADVAVEHSQFVRARILAQSALATFQFSNERRALLSQLLAGR